MKRFRLCARLQVGLVKLSQNFVVDRTPTIILKAQVPSIVIIVFWFVIVDVDRLLARLLFHLHIVTRRESTNVHDTSMTEDLVVDERREFLSAKSEPHMTLRCGIQQTGLSRIN